MEGITAESTAAQLFEATVPVEGQTALRIFQFDPTQFVFVLHGPEAGPLAAQFVQFAEALFKALEEREESGERLVIPDAGLR